MKIKDIAKTVDKSSDNSCWVNMCEIGEDLGIENVPYIDQERLQSFWIANWLCTDSYVGYRIYFFDGDLIAYSLKEYRKSNTSFYWLDKENVKRLKEYLYDISRDDSENFAISDIELDIGDWINSKSKEENFSVFYKEEKQNEKI